MVAKRNPTRKAKKIETGTETIVGDVVGHQALGQVPKSQQGREQAPWAPGACVLAACVMEMPFPNSLALAKIHSPPLKTKHQQGCPFPHTGGDSDEPLFRSQKNKEKGSPGRGSLPVTWCWAQGV